jgi:hypothetical protein
MMENAAIWGKLLPKALLASEQLRSVLALPEFDEKNPITCEFLR